MKIIYLESIKKIKFIDIKFVIFFIRNGFAMNY